MFVVKNLIKILWYFSGGDRGLRGWCVWESKFWRYGGVSEVFK